MTAHTTEMVLALADPLPTPNEATCDSMDRACSLAATWFDTGDTEGLPELLAWVRLRVQAYDDSAETWCRESMAEWIAQDLALEESDARRLCAAACSWDGAQS